MEPKAWSLAISKAEPAMLADSTTGAAAGLELVVVPLVREMIGGQVQLDQLRQFNVVDLLGRLARWSWTSPPSGVCQGQVVLVTGAGGSIGSELAEQVHALEPARLILLTRMIRAA